MRPIPLLLLLLCSGCTALGLASPQSFDESLANAYGVHTAVVNATTTALTAGAISSKEAALVQTQAITARSMLDAAKAAETAGNTSGAKNDLTLATAALTALESYLNAKGAK